MQETNSDPTVTHHPFDCLCVVLISTLYSFIGSNVEHEMCCCSVPMMSGSSGSPEDGSTQLPHIPVRRESSKSLVTSSSEDESNKRRKEIMDSVAKTVEKQASLSPSIGKIMVLSFNLQIILFITDHL